MTMTMPRIATVISSKTPEMGEHPLQPRRSNDYDVCNDDGDNDDDKDASAHFRITYLSLLKKFRCTL